MQEKDFFSRSDIAVFSAATNDQALALHIEERANLIVTTFGLPGLSCESLFTMIRQSKGLRAVSTMILCEDTRGLRERGARCGANVVVTLPIDPTLFVGNIQKLLDAAPRRSYRVVLNVVVEGMNKDRSFLCNSENISEAGILIKTEETLAHGDRLSCSFYLPDGTKVNAQGEIVRAAQEAWSKTNQYGVKFTDMIPGIKTAIEAFINKERQQRDLGSSPGYEAHTSSEM